MIPCVSLTETSVLGNMKERVKEMRVFGCRLNFWALTPKLAATKGIIIARVIYYSLIIYFIRMQWVIAVSGCCDAVLREEVE